MSGLASTTRRFTFSAGHRYHVAAWSADRNEQTFGRLTVPHGHNYTLDVTVRGPIDERTGMVIDRLDNADLNTDSLFRDRIPTTENIAIAVWELLAPKLGPDRLARVRVWEDPTLFVDYDGS